MKHYLGLSSLGVGGAVIVMAAQPLMAAPATQVTQVRVNPTNTGVEVVLQTRDGARPQVFTVNRGNTWVADMINTQLRLSDSESFRQDNPAPGISSVVVLPLDTNSIRVIVTGQTGAPTGQIAQRDRGGLVLSLTRPAGSETAQANPAPATQGGQSGSTAAPAPAPTARTEDVLVPNPRITIDGVPVAPDSPNVAPPFLPRAVAPPVGDIVVSNVDATATEIDLGSAERVPRLVLRDAPVREVLSLLARAAGLNLAFSTEGGGDQQGQQQAQGQPGAGTGGPTISLDIENEPVQNVFNYVLRLSNLEANRVGQTIFVAPRLPNAARDVLVRTFRMNQVSAEQAAGFLVSMGAESAVTTTQPVTTVTAIPVQGAEGAPPITRTDTTNRTVVDTQRIELEDSAPVLRGLQVLVDTRLNTVTLVGARKLIEVASGQLVQLDLRRRQVAVNVKIVDVNLANTKNFGSSFSFGVDQSRAVNTGGIGIINFGSTAPAVTGITSETLGGGPVAGGGLQAFNFARQFLLQLQASIASNNAKILTDPTLVVQEGQQATVNLTQEVVGDIETTITTGDNPIITTEIEKEDTGLILTVNVERIDDNGFVSLSVAPQVIALAGTQQVTLAGSGAQTIALLSERSLTSGTIRLRDGQTLILSGIIQDQDRVNARKIPILGDLPILGALFRSTEKVNQRAEVIVLLTPQILDDSDVSAYGYNYAPSPDVRQILERGTTRAPER